MKKMYHVSNIYFKNYGSVVDILKSLISINEKKKKKKKIYRYKKKNLFFFNPFFIKDKVSFLKNKTSTSIENIFLKHFKDLKDENKFFSFYKIFNNNLINSMLLLNNINNNINNTNIIDYDNLFLDFFYLSIIKLYKSYVILLYILIVFGYEYNELDYIYFMKKIYFSYVYLINIMYNIHFILFDNKFILK